MPTPAELRQGQPTRGVAWVLRWAAALATIMASAAVLAEFAYSLAAEQWLSRAARAGVVEATLPGATYRSVEQAVWRRVGSIDRSAAAVELQLELNGSPIRGKFAPRENDRFSITLALPTSAVLPAWMRAATPLRSDSQIVVRAEREMPGSRLN